LGAGGSLHCLSRMSMSAARATGQKARRAARDKDLSRGFIMKSSICL
jgi:hypothetical protein